MEEKTNYLVHHGVKGQRWGVRRYQNPDGTLTIAGQKRLTKLQKKSAKLLSQNAKYEKKKYKAAKWDNKDKLMKYTKKSYKSIKKRAKIEKKIYKLQNRSLKAATKYQKQKGREAVEAALKEAS